MVTCAAHEGNAFATNDPYLHPLAQLFYTSPTSAPHTPTPVYTLMQQNETHTCIPGMHCTIILSICKTHSNRLVSRAYSPLNGLSFKTLLFPAV